MARIAFGMLALALIASSGCVQRRFVIETSQPGALVFQNGRPLGATPVDGQFDYYGTYNFTIVKDGFQTKTVQQRIVPPWFAYPPLDFIVENLYPGTIEDVRHFQFDLDPLARPQVQELLQEGQELRERGIQLPPPSVPSLREPDVRPVPVLPAPQQPLPAPRPLPPGGGPILGEPQPQGQPEQLLPEGVAPLNRTTSTPRPRF